VGIELRSAESIKLRRPLFMDESAGTIRSPVPLGKNSLGRPARGFGPEATGGRVRGHFSPFSPDSPTMIVAAP
jgi:hypothetical protein